MANQDFEAARRYHEGTKHPGGFLMNPHHRYQPGLEPLPLKIYAELEPIPLPTDVSPLSVPALEAIVRLDTDFSHTRIPDLATLGRILYFSAGITKKIEYPWGEMYFRAAACTGALYHIELYLVCGDLPDLSAGVYHFQPNNQALVRLRSGDYRGALVEASGEEPGIAVAPVTLLLSDVYWRNAVKYQAREYRHTYWDSGTILSQTLAICTAHELPARIVMGYADEPVNRLLDLDVQREAVIALVSVGATPGVEIPPAPEITPLARELVPISEREVIFQPILDVHAASSLGSGDEAAAWRERATPLPLPSPSDTLIPLPEASLPDDPIETVILRRGSTRRFNQEPISLAQLSLLLRQSMRGVPADFVPPGDFLTHAYLIVHAVDRLAPGAYLYHPRERALEQLRPGDFRTEAGELALGQDLAADAAANIYFLTDLDEVLGRLGNRGYRAAQMEASIAAGRIYLAAYAQRLGATGLTFFDDAVAEFFAPHAEGKSVMFLVAVGKKARRRSL